MGNLVLFSAAEARSPRKVQSLLLAGRRDETSHLAGAYSQTGWSQKEGVYKSTTAPS